MKTSTDIRVQKFLEDFEMFDGQKFLILQELRKIVFEIFPTVKERIMYGGIMFSLEEDFGGIFPSKKHISFEFGAGIKMKDPESFLEGTGKFRRHLKIKNIDEIESKNVKFFVAQV